MLRIYYIAHLSGETKIWIDAMDGEKGASKFWEHNELELALETWSSHPSKKNVISTNNFTEPKNSIYIYHIQKITALSYNCVKSCGVTEEIIYLLFYEKNIN
jgi:hypothetical protein